VADQLWLMTRIREEEVSLWRNKYDTSIIRDKHMYVYSLRYVSMSTIFSEYTVSANYTQVHVFTAIAVTFLVIRVCGNVIMYVFFL